jgi:hypothetical protein
MPANQSDSPLSRDCHASAGGASTTASLQVHSTVSPEPSQCAWASVLHDVDASSLPVQNVPEHIEFSQLQKNHIFCLRGVSTFRSLEVRLTSHKQRR